MCLNRGSTSTYKINGDVLCNDFQDEALLPSNFFKVEVIFCLGFLKFFGLMLLRTLLPIFIGN